MVVAGNPAKIICSTKDYIEKNRDYNLNSYGLSFEDKRKMLKSLPEEKFIHK